MILTILMIINDGESISDLIILNKLFTTSKILYDEKYGHDDDIINCKKCSIINRFKNDYI